MAYNYFVPMMNRQITDETRGEYLRLLRELSATRFFIAFERDNFFKDNRKEDLELLSENVAFFENEGYEVGVWLQAFGFGEPLCEEGKAALEPFTHIRHLDGTDVGDAFCPEDKNILDRYLGLIHDIVSISKPKMLMLDDDLCLSARNGLGCFCERHMNILRNKLGENLTREELGNLIFTRGKNPYRDAYLEVMGGSLRDFCNAVEKTVHSVDPEIRVGHCAGYTSFDLEGADAFELSRILAGKNKPYLRLSGAPYWVARDRRRFGSQRLGSVIEFTRIQERWAREEGIEVFAETDLWPRPRYHIPASLGVSFDLAVAASGGMDNLIYPLDYYSPYDYETGYSAHFKRNLPHIRFIEENFSDKETFGVKIFEDMKRFHKTELPEKLGDHFLLTKPLSFSAAASLLTAHSVPISYEDGASVGISFGINVLGIKEMPKKMIIDFPAARLLMEKGIDVGFDSFEKIPFPSFEIKGKTKVLLFDQKGEFYAPELKSGANVLSEFDSDTPAVYRYKGGETEFLVLCYDGYSVDEATAITNSYLRGEELYEFIGDIPHIKKAPGVYSLAKKNETETALLFINIYEDWIIDFEVELGDKFKEVKAFGISGKLDGKKFIPDDTIAPYGSFSLILKK